MKLKIRCNYKKEKIHIETDADNIRLAMLILNVFNHKKTDRYGFLFGLGLLLLMLVATKTKTVYYDRTENLSAITPVVILLASSICKQGPPCHYF